jgi:hypothetical protein
MFLKYVWLVTAQWRSGMRKVGKCEESLTAMFWRTFKSGFTA